MKNPSSRVVSFADRLADELRIAQVNRSMRAHINQAITSR
jgi:hypothetical protein